MATTETVTSANVVQGLSLINGSWTSETSTGIHTITCPRHVSFVWATLASGATSPNILWKHQGESDETMLITGTTGVITSPADSAGITITNNADGTSTIAIAATSQTASGTNHWFALAKA